MTLKLRPHSTGNDAKMPTILKCPDGGSSSRHLLRRNCEIIYSFKGYISKLPISKQTTHTDLHIVVGVGSRIEARRVFDGVPQLPSVARHFVTEELVGQRPVVGVAAEALEVPVGDSP